jgi:excisionase family DNA binding protein
VKRYLSVRQLCELLPVRKSFIYRLIHDGGIPSTRLGGRILIPEDELARLLEQGRDRMELEPQDAPDPEVPAALPRPKRRGKPGLEMW